MENKDKIYEIFSNIMELDIDLVTDDLSYDSLNEWDSLSHIKLILALENGFGITFDSNNISKMISVKLIEEVINKQTK